LPHAAYGGDLIGAALTICSSASFALCQVLIGCIFAAAGAASSWAVVSFADAFAAKNSGERVAPSSYINGLRSCGS
jgi:hypothetical protein